MSHNIQHIIKEYQEKIYKTCLGFTHDPEEAKDLLQEVCIHLWQGLEKFRQEATVSTWVYRVTVNTCLMYQRKKKLDTVALSTVETSKMATEPIVDTGEQKLKLLQQLIVELPEKERLIMILYLENLSYEEIAEVMGISTNYIGVKINRIKKVLTKKVNNHGRVKTNMAKSRGLESRSRGFARNE